jgi:hypothetical protein
MYFCPKCNYSFDVSKASSLDGENDIRKKLDNIESAIKKLELNKDMSDYIATFTIAQLEENEEYNKLSNEMKDKLKQGLFDKTASYGGIIFKCNNCNYKKKIKETIKLYQLNVDSVYSVYRSVEDNKLLAMNPIYPRTKNYTCKNINCITHKKSDSKEAVFFREKDSYLTNYVCNVCFSSWKV